MTKLASSYSLMAFDGPIRDQQNLGSCTAFATTTVIDTMMREAGHELPLLSTLAFYGEERDHMGFYKYDVGAGGADMIYASTQKGFVPESEWAYDTSKMAVRPPAEVTAQEYNNHVTSWTYIPSTQTVTGMVNSVKQALSEGKPVELFFTPQSYFFQELGPLNTLQGYGPHDSEARHAVEIIGCDDNLNGGSYIIHNSWNPNEWGDHGYGVISYKQFTPNFDHTEIQGFYVMNGFVSNGVTYDFTYSANRTTVDTAYATILGRAAEVGGLDWWSNHIGSTPSVLADALINSAEGNLIYGKMDDAAFVDQVYVNVLGRHADSGGLVYWEDALHTGLTRGQLFEGIITSVNRPTAEAHDLLTNKVNIAMYMSVALQLDSGHDQQTHDIIAQVNNDYSHTEVLKVGLADILHNPVTIV